jgi:hypothetical protein
MHRRIYLYFLSDNSKRNVQIKAGTRQELNPAGAALIGTSHAIAHFDCRRRAHQCQIKTIEQDN